MAGQLWVTDTLGGLLYSDELSQVLREAVQPAIKFRQFCDVKDATNETYGKKLHKGHLFTWDVVSNLQTQGGTLVETNTMPQTNFTVRQGTLTITEFGNSVPFTGKLQDMSAFSLKDIINKQLKNDAKKAFDIAAHAQFNRTLLRVVPASSGTSTTSLSLTTNGTATGTNNIALRSSHVRLITTLMKERDIPPYMNDDYMAIARPGAFSALKSDMEAIHTYTERGLGMIMNGEIGRYDGVRFVEQTQIPAGGAANSTTWNAATRTADAWDNGLSDWVFFFGEDTVAEAPVIPEEIRGMIPQDYGRSHGMAWYALDGFALVHDATGGEQARIIKWDSAA